MRSSRFSYGDGLTEVAPVVPAVRSVPTPGAFVACPIACGMPGEASVGLVQELYRLAYQQAQAALLPPWHERQLLASPN